MTDSSIDWFVSGRNLLEMVLIIGSIRLACASANAPRRGRLKFAWVAATVAGAVMVFGSSTSAGMACARVGMLVVGNLLAYAFQRRAIRKKQAKSGIGPS